jgi:hypothetical protein
MARSCENPPSLPLSASCTTCGPKLVAVSVAALRPTPASSVKPTRVAIPPPYDETGAAAATPGDKKRSLADNFLDFVQVDLDSRDVKIFPNGVLQRRSPLSADVEIALSPGVRKGFCGPDLLSVLSSVFITRLEHDPKPHF